MFNQQRVVPLDKMILVCVALIILSPAIRSPAQSVPMVMPNGDTPAASDPNATLPEFDVASVKENKSGTGMMEVRSNADGFSCKNLNLKNLIASAYNVNMELISGAPAWVDSTGFDINAKVAGEDLAAFKKLTGKQRGAMLRPLLEDRFKLKAHIENKMLPIYDLEVAKAGPKLQLSKAPNFDKDKPNDAAVKYAGSTESGPGYFKAYGIKISNLAENLTYTVNRTVIDKTGLTGTYDINLKYAPEEDSAPSKPDNGTDPAPSIFTALQEQLGLKLQSTKGPVDTLVIDHVEKPAEN